MKLRLPNKLIAAIMAAASPVLFQTLSTATLGAAAVAVMVGEQAEAETITINKGDTVNVETLHDGDVVTGSGTLKLNVNGFSSDTTASDTASQLNITFDEGWTGTVDATTVANNSVAAGGAWDNVYKKRFVNLLLNNTNISGGTLNLRSEDQDVQLADCNSAPTDIAGNYVFSTTTIHTGGTLRLANYNANKTWVLGSGSKLDIAGQLWVDHRQTLLIQDGGQVETTGGLRLGYDTNNNSADLIMTGATSSLKTTTITTHATRNQSSDIILKGGTVEFTHSNGNVLTTNGDASVTLGGTGDEYVYLKATENSWSLWHNGMSIGKAVVQTSGDHTITLGADSKATNFIASLHNEGALTVSGTLGALGDIHHFEAYTGDGLTDGPTGGNVYSDSDKNSGFLTSSGAYYMVKSSNDGTLTLTDTANATGITTQKVGNDLVFWVTAQTTDKVYYINANQDFEGAKMNTATNIVVAPNITFSATGLNIAGTAGRTVTLHSSATLQTNGNTGLNQIQMVTLNVGGDATINTQTGHVLSMTASNYNATTINLNGHTLTKSGAGSFYMFSTTIDKGVINVTEGNLGISGYGQGGKNITAKDTLIKLAAGTRMGFNGNTTLLVEGIDTAGATATITNSDGIGSSDANGARNLKLNPEAGKTYTFKGSVLSDINYTLAGAGKQIFELTAATTLGSIDVQSGSLAFSGTSAATLGGNITNNSVGTAATLSFTNATIANNQTRTFSGSGTTLINNLTLGQNAVMKLSEGAVVKVDKDSGTYIEPSLGNGFSINLAAGSVLDMSAKSVNRDRLQKLLANTTGEGTLKVKTWSTGHQSSDNQIQLDGSDFSLNVAHLDITQTFTINNYRGTGINSLIIGAQNDVTVHGDMILQTRAGLDVSGQLTINGTLGVGYPGSDAYTAGLHIRDGAQVKAQSITINNPSAKEVLMEGGTLELTGNSAGHGILSGNTADIRLLGGELKADGHSWDIAREVTLGDIAFNTVQSGDTITLNANIALDGVLTNKGAGTLAVNSSLINVSAVTLGEMGSFSEGDNGLLQGGEVYIIRNEGSARVTLGNAVTAQVNGYDAEIAVKDDGSGVVLNNLAEIDSVYFINKGTVTYSDASTGDIAADTVTGLSLTGGTLVLEKTLDKFDRLEISNHRATLSIGTGITQDAAKITLKDLAAQYGFILTGGGVLKLTGTSNDNATANGKLLSVLSSDDSESGSGHVLLSGTANMAGLSGTQLKGDLEITSDGTLNLTTAKDQFIDLSSLTQLTLSGGTINTESKLGEVHNLTVTAASTLNFNDYNNFTSGNPTDAIRTYFRGETALSNTLTIYTEYKSALNFEQLTGNGTLKLTTSSVRSDQGARSVVDSLQSFTGSLLLQGGNENDLVRMTAKTGNGQAVNMNNITAENATLEMQLAENLTLNNISITGAAAAQGSSTTAVTFNTTGTAKLTANKIEMVGGALTLAADTDVTTLKFQSNSSGLSSALTIAAGATLHVTGTVTAAPEGGSGGSFELCNWAAANTLNINGNLIAEAGITMEGGGTPTVNINNGGTMTMNGGLFVAMRQGTPSATINVENGGTLQLGTVASSITNRKDGYVTVNLKNGATLKGAYKDSADVADIQKGMTIAEESATVNLMADAGKTLLLSGGLTGNTDTATIVIKAGENVSADTQGTVSLANNTQLKGVHVEQNMLLKLKSGVSLSVNELVLGDTSGIAPAAETEPESNPIVLSDGDLKAEITVTGDQTEHGTIAVGIGGSDVKGVNMTVSGHVDYSAIPGNILDLNGGSLTLSTLESPSKTYLSDSLVGQLDHNIRIEVMTGIGALTVNNFSLSADDIAGLDEGDMIVVGTADSVFATAGGNSVGGSNAQVIFRADGNNTGTLLVTPEPTTTALSLLALSALAARRRRK